MRYLLDTCVVSDFAKGQANTLERIKATLFFPNRENVPSGTCEEIENTHF
jgi:predicted nucleic acid-binding protein